MLLVGTMLHGFCGGEFGRDSYAAKRVEAAGADWVVAREIESGTVAFAEGPRIHDKLAAFLAPPHPDEFQDAT